MYLDNKYTKWYNSIIENAKNRIIDGYTEKHHIIPRSLGGNDEPSNLVKLTAKEHFICHLLLTKMTTGLARRSMAYAAWQMTIIKNRPRYKVSSRTYDYLKQTLSETYKGICRKGKDNPFYGKRHSVQTLRLQSQVKSGKNNPNYGVKQKPEWNKKKSEAQKGIPKPPITCEHCGKTVGGHGNYFRWHGDRCRLNNSNAGEVSLQKS
jgi:hypothetical protein